MLAIVFGGKSVEHDVSVVTAKQIYNICKKTHETKLIYVDKNGDFWLYTNENFDFSDFKGDNQYLKKIIFSDGNIYKKSLFGYIKGDKIDCALLCLHGGDGENGKISSALEQAKIPVSAGNHVALGISMNKWLSKMFFKANNIPCVKGFFANEQTNIDVLDKQITSSFNYPVIVKANGGGSSIGIKTAHNKDELRYALQVALQFDSSAVVEQEIKNFREFNCAVLGDEENMQCSKIDEPKRQEEILSFNDKYLSNQKQKGKHKSSRNYPKLDERIEDKIKNISKQIFTTLGFWGVVRIDYIYSENDKKIYVNEINAIPGSLANYYFASSQIEQGQFIDKLIKIAKDNFEKQQKINKNYITKLF